MAKGKSRKDHKPPIRVPIATTRAYTDDERHFARIARELADWLCRDSGPIDTSPSGAFVDQIERLAKSGEFTGCPSAPLSLSFESDVPVLLCRSASSRFRHPLQYHSPADWLQCRLDAACVLRECADDAERRFDAKQKPKDSENLKMIADEQQSQRSDETVNKLPIMGEDYWKQVPANHGSIRIPGSASFVQDERYFARLARSFAEWLKEGSGAIDPESQSFKSRLQHIQRMAGAVGFQRVPLSIEDRNGAKYLRGIATSWDFWRELDASNDWWQLRRDAADVLQEWADEAVRRFNAKIQPNGDMSANATERPSRQSEEPVEGLRILDASTRKQLELLAEQFSQASSEWPNLEHTLITWPANLPDVEPNRSPTGFGPTQRAPWTAVAVKDGRPTFYAIAGGFFCEYGTRPKDPARNVTLMIPRRWFGKSGRRDDTDLSSEDMDAAHRFTTLSRHADDLYSLLPIELVEHRYWIEKVHALSTLPWRQLPGHSPEYQMHVIPDVFIESANVLNRLSQEAVKLPGTEVRHALMVDSSAREIVYRTKTYSMIDSDAFALFAQCAKSYPASFKAQELDIRPKRAIEKLPSALKSLIKSERGAGCKLTLPQGETCGFK